ncbi:MAG: metal-sensitive transcriptional regulator [Deltaproteobacteria bacterium]|nr:MAG: metal-sensitive transcriptional regulator [Deltaproteobacteria bacterium]
MVKPDTKKQAQVRIKRIAGQVAGIERMIQQDRYCVDVLMQISAVRAALDQVGKLVLGSHIETCVAEAFTRGGPRERRQKLDELMDVFSRFGHIRER